MSRTRNSKRLLLAFLAVCAVGAAAWYSFAFLRPGTAPRSAAAPQPTPTPWAITGIPATLDHHLGAVRVDARTLVTGDGGATFTPITPPPPGDADPSLYTAFLTSTTGWAGTTQPSTSSYTSVVTIWRTTDAGHSWQSATLPPFAVPLAHVVDFRFLDSRRGWVVVSLLNGNQHNPGALFGTTDGGATWTPLSLPYAGQVYFLNATTGWLVGSRVPTSGPNFLAITHDGGQTWQQETPPVPAPAGYQPLAVSIGAPMMFTTDVGAIPVGYGTSVQLDTTRDGGATWSAGAVFTLSTNVTTTVLATASAGRTGYVAMAGYPGHLYRTQDAGQTWTETRPANFDGAFSLHFVSPTNGWAYTFGGTCTGPKGSQTCVNTWNMQRTTDGGATWKTTYSQTVPS